VIATRVAPDVWERTELEMIATVLDIYAERAKAAKKARRKSSAKEE